MTRRKDPRSARTPIAAFKAQGGELPDFTPVPRQCNRHDGWTPARQRAFIEALADLGSVEAACRVVDMSSVGAYHLRRQPGAEAFRAAWEVALDLGVKRIEDVAMDLALNGVEEPVYSYGKLVGTRIKRNDSLLMFILRNRAPERFAAGGGAKAMNAVGKMELERLKKEWIAEYEAQQRQVTTADIRASIDRKIDDIRRRIERERPARHAALSDETRAAFAHFIALRDRDLAARDADESTRKMVEVTIDVEATRFDPPERPALPSPSTQDDDKNEDWQRPPPGWGAKPPPREPRTTWTVRDDNFDP